MAIIEMTLKVCPQCGRDDRWTPFPTGGLTGWGYAASPGKFHFWKGKRCDGKPIDVQMRGECPY